MRLTARMLVGLVLAATTPGITRGQAVTPGAGTNAPSATGVHRRALWTASGALLAGAVIFDERIRTAVLAQRSPELNRLASPADVLGTAGHIVPALVSTYVGARVFGKRSFANATLRVGLAYAAADALESVLKPAVGRVRPFEGREPLTFRPFSAGGEFQSFPSAHVVHISSLASAISMEANRPWVTALGSAAVAYVGVQRVYRDQHWSSDVVASGMLGVEVAEATLHWLHARADNR